MDPEKLRTKLIEAVNTLQTSTDPIERQQAANILTNFITEVL